MPGKIAQLKERNVTQELSNRDTRLVEGIFVRDKHDGTLAIAFVPKRGHVSSFRLSPGQTEELTEWLLDTA